MDTKTVTAISKFITDNSDTLFEWGSFDCCTVINEIINLQTGLDLYQPYRGNYNSELGAAKIQIKLGTIRDALDDQFERINPLLARRGDVHELEDGVMAFQFSGFVWAACKDGLKITDKKPVITWRIE